MTEPRDQVLFGELPDEAQDLLAAISIAEALIEKHLAAPKEGGLTHVQESLEKAFGHGWNLAILCVALLDRLRLAEADLEALREQLQKIGRKSFWAARDLARRTDSEK